MRTWQGICLSAVLLISLADTSRAQTATPDIEYKKLIQVDTAIQPLGEHPFGEQVDLYKGTLSFEETDISLQGNGPAMQLSRSLSTTDAVGYTFNFGYAFGDWDLNIPRIETASANQATVTGWQVYGPSPLNRCSAFGPPPYVASAQLGGDTWGPDQWWYGYHLIVPGEGDQRLLQGGGAASPVINGQTSQISTKQNWAIGCGVTADDGGEGFLAIAPDGTKYTFSHLVYRPMTFMQKPLGTGPDGNAIAAFKGIHTNAASFNILARRDALMYVTQVQDRFGNTLTYHYDSSTGYLASIAASDGRQITLTYVSGTPLIQTVSTQAADGTSRTWTYSYGSIASTGLSTLTSVALPDGSAWSYDLAQFAQDPISVTMSNCYLNSLGTVNPDPVSGTVTTPSGLTGTFALAPLLHGRSYVPKGCFGGDGGNQAVYFSIPDGTYQQSIASETITGAGLPTQPDAYTWTYAYSLPNQSWKTDSCATNSTCAATVYVDVTDPNQNATRYTFSNRFDASEGQLKQTDYYSGAVAGGTLLRSEINTYADPATGAWPASYGIDLGDRDNIYEATELSPLNLRQTLQDGDTYMWQAESFNAYAQITETKRSNLIAGQNYLEETTSYLNDASLWVLGLPLQVTNVATGEVESSNTYAANDTLLTRARFGQPLMSYTFNTAGQLASFTDGNSHTTSLSNYKRGIPQTIGYPDSTSETLVVDDFGQISNITDQSGHATSYGYDGVGRVTAINYPGGDELAWTPQSFTYSFVTSAERGVAANHWKRTSTLGSANTITYFDAMLRPVLSDSDIGSTVQASTMTTYDAKGQKIFSAYPSATALTFTQSPTVAGSTTTYDALERATQAQQTSELGTLTSSIAYVEAAGKKVTDPKGNVTTTYYQVFDEPTYDAVQAVYAPAGITQLIARDVYGNPTTITQSGLYGTESDNLTKTLTYDSYHRLCRTTEPESGSEVMSYDAANNLAWSASGLAITGTGCGQEQVATAAQTTRTYDAMNRVHTILPPTGTQSTTYGYDPVGRMTSAVSGISSWGGTYNFRGMLTGESLQVTGQNPWAIGYAHDASGSLSLIHYPDGENVNYTPDALGRATQVGSYATSIGYFPNGQVSQFVYGNGTGYAAEQNTRQLLSNFSYGPGATAQLSEDLAYDPDGNITTVTDLASGPRSKSFGYDALNRLTSANAAGLWGTQAYTYDALNNLRTLQTGSQTATYTYDATNKLTSISGALTASYTYDSRGNVATKNSTTLSFDQKNQLTNISAETFAYDAAGRRVSKVNGSTTTYYFYNQAGQLMYQMDPVALTSTNFVYLGSKMIARDAGYATHVVGNVDGAYVDGSNNAVVNGWACSTSVAASINVELFVGGPSGGGGTRIATATANVASEPAVAAICLTSGTTYRFSIPLTVAQRTTYANASIYMYGDSPVGAGNLLLSGSGAHTIPPYIPTTGPVLSVPAISSNGSYTVSWAAVSGASSYTLQERVNGGAWNTIQTSAALSSSLSGKAAAVYGYQAQACNNNGCGPWGSVASTTVVYPPAAPASITVPATSTGSVAISWASSATTMTYGLDQSFNGGAWGQVYATGGTSVTLTVGTTGSYSYRAYACNAGGCSGYAVSSAVAVTRPPTSAPALTVPATSYSGSYTVSWGAAAGSTSYTLQEQVNGGAWTTILSSNVLSDALSGKGSGSYGYRVQGCNVAGCGPISGTGTIVVTLVPTAPTSISAPTSEPYPAGSWTVSWPAVSGATNYILQRTKSGTTSVVTVYNGPAASTTDGNSLLLTVGSFVYSVQACNVAGCSGWRNSAPLVIFCPQSPAVETQGIAQPQIIKCGSASMVTGEGAQP